MRIDPRGRVKDIASASEEAERVLETCGVDFCCRGEASLDEACAVAGVNPLEVERQLRDLPDAGPARQWDDVADLVDDVVGSGHPDTRAAIARVRDAAAMTQSGDLDAALDQLEALSSEQMRAEGALFQRVRALADARSARGPFPEPPFTTIHVHGARIREGHGRIHDQLRHVRAIAHAPGVDSLPLRRALEGLVHAMVSHMHLVNNELLPRAQALEPE
jgi:iron-sulfur cluster repair protein YtfE (RIC family)